MIKLMIYQLISCRGKNYFIVSHFNKKKKKTISSLGPFYNVQ